jgi:hypothetical protein
MTTVSHILIFRFRKEKLEIYPYLYNGDIRSNEQSYENIQHITDTCFSVSFDLENCNLI